jgi:tetratricopeptide (TPR) repeat protein
MITRRRYMKKSVILILAMLLFSSFIFAADMSDEQWVKYGNAQFQKGQYDQAIESYQKAIGINPNNYFASLYCGTAYLKVNDNNNALAYLKKAYSLNPTPQIKARIDSLEGDNKPAQAQQQQTVEEDNQLYYKTGSPVKFNKKVGINISGISESAHHKSYSSKTGLMGGLAFMYGFGELFSLQAELLYTQKGACILNTKDFQEINYVEIPALVKINFFPLRRVMVGVYAGPEVDFKTLAKAYNKNDDRVYNIIDYGASFGADITYPIAFIWLNADLRYTAGMANISAVTGSGVSELKNSAITFSIGIIF